MNRRTFIKSSVAVPAAVGILAAASRRLNPKQKPPKQRQPARSNGLGYSCTLLDTSWKATTKERSGSG